MSEQQKQMMEANTRLMAEMDVEALAKVNAFLTGVALAAKNRQESAKSAAPTDKTKADERKEA